MKNRRKKRRGRAGDEGAYVCPHCGERIVIPVDPSRGPDQRYVEDSPVSCNPNVIHLELFDDGREPRAWAEAG
jgi:hypothetical protein